jgi:hypothetical protein
MRTLGLGNLINIVTRFVAPQVEARGRIAEEAPGTLVTELGRDLLRQICGGDGADCPKGTWDLPPPIA